MEPATNIYECIWFMVDYNPPMSTTDWNILKPMKKITNQTTGAIMATNPVLAAEKFYATHKPAIDKLVNNFTHNKCAVAVLVKEHKTIAGEDNPVLYQHFIK